MQEQSCGDGAASLLIGEGEAIATLEGFHSLSYDFVDYWRSDNDRYDRLWEDRWIRDIGYSRFIPAAITGLLQKYGLDIKDFRIIRPRPEGADDVNYGVWVEFRKPPR